LAILRGREGELLGGGLTFSPALFVSFDQRRGRDAAGVDDFERSRHRVNRNPAFEILGDGMVAILGDDRGIGA
jgi:hypothetical protein